jgi:hypothetical protein
LLAQRRRPTFERVADLDVHWGGSIHMCLAFRDHGWLSPSVRNLVVRMCTEYLVSEDVSQQLVTAVQELLENLVKYSASERSVLDFELLVLDGQPTARLCTQNHASPSHLDEVRRLLDGIIGAADPLELYRYMVAGSGDRPGSGLGLARLRAEVGLALSYRIDAGGRLRLEASRPVEARSADAARSLR